MSELGGGSFDQGALKARQGLSTMPVDYPRSVKIVRRQLGADAIAGEDADAKAAHLAGYVPEHDVIVVQLDPEHGVGQPLDHLALEFDLVPLGHCASHPVKAPPVGPGVP